MEEVDDVSTRLASIFDLDGAEISRTLDIDESTILPQNAFDDAAPDDEV